MTRILATLGLTALLASPVLAQDAPTIPDTDGNGTWSMEELKAAYPKLDEETFAKVDTSGDGQVDQAELDAAIAAGTLTQ